MNEKQTKEQSAIDSILKAMEQAAEDQRKVLEAAHQESIDVYRKFLNDQAQDPNKIYWKG